MTTIFLDTVGLIALWNKNDQWHAGAVRAFQSHRPSTSRIVTTTLILLECANHAVRRSFRDEVVQLRLSLQAAGDLYEPTHDEIELAWAEYAAGAPGSPGVVDLTSFALMRRLGIHEAFTNDQHFTTAGFTVLF